MIDEVCVTYSRIPWSSANFQRMIEQVNALMTSVPSQTWDHCLTSVSPQTEGAFREFLHASRDFYLTLLKSVQEVYGNESFASSLPVELQPQSQSPTTENVAATVCRCLICLGDLTR